MLLSATKSNLSTRLWLGRQETIRKTSNRDGNRGAKINSVIFSPAGTKLVYIIPLIWEKLTINFHEWDQFFNFHECEARVKIMRIDSHEWKLFVNSRKSVVLRANSGIKYQESPIVIEEQKLTINTPSAEGVLLVIIPWSRN